MVNHKILQTIALGAIAGMRSAAAPAIVADMIHKSTFKSLQHTRLSFLDTTPVRLGLKLFAAAEMAGDKSSKAPDRTKSPLLFGRALSGAFVGALFYKSSGSGILKGALIGGLSAVAATYFSFYIRKKAGEKSGISDKVLGGIEDALVFTSGLALRKSV